MWVGGRTPERVLTAEWLRSAGADGPGAGDDGPDVAGPAQGADEPGLASRPILSNPRRSSFKRSIQTARCSWSM